MTSTSYLVAWRTLAGLLTALGVLLACVRFQLSVLAACALYAGLVGLAVPDFVPRRAGGPQEARDGSDGPLPKGLRRRLGCAALAALSTVALLGLVTVFGTSAVVVAALVAAGSPRAVAWSRRAGRHQSPAGAAQAATDAELRAPAEMTYDELCRAWRATGPQVRQSSDPRTRAELVEARRRYLDELERRDPAAFARWLRSGAGAASDPSGFSAGRRW